MQRCFPRAIADKPNLVARSSQLCEGVEAILARHELSADDVQADACGMGQSTVFRVNTQSHDTDGPSSPPLKGKTPVIRILVVLLQMTRELIGGRP